MKKLFTRPMVFQWSLSDTNLKKLWSQGKYVLLKVLRVLFFSCWFSAASLTFYFLQKRSRTRLEFQKSCRIFSLFSSPCCCLSCPTSFSNWTMARSISQFLLTRDTQLLQERWHGFRNHTTVERTIMKNTAFTELTLTPALSAWPRLQADHSFVASSSPESAFCKNDTNRKGC